MTTRRKAAIVLAAGKGKRMFSDLPKVLHPINGKPMICVLMDTLHKMEFEKIVVVIGHCGEQVQKTLESYGVQFAWQREQLGTGHAVMMTRDIMEQFDGTTLVTAGDVPLISQHSIEKLFKTHESTGAKATCLSAIAEDATGYGRIIRGNSAGELREIVEQRDASPSQLAIQEYNSGTFCFDNKALFVALTGLSNNNAQAEYYLTDTIKIMHDKGLRVSVEVAENPDEVRGVNDTSQLEELARIHAKMS